MKRLIALILIAPSLASAQGLICHPFPGQRCGPQLTITSGTLTLTENGGLPGVADWGASGSGFTTAGGSGSISKMGSSYPIPYSVGTWSSYSLDNADTTLSMGLDVHGVSYFYDPESQTFAGAVFQFEAPGPITHLGTYTALFSFESNLNGQPSNSFTNICTDPSNPCTNWPVNGSGTGVIYVSDDPSVADYFDVTGGTFTFRAPEPSTASLLLLGFAGIAVLWRRRKPPTMSPHSPGIISAPALEPNARAYCRCCVRFRCI
jgi:hypothetical protein